MAHEARSPLDSISADQPSCRLCWASADDEEGGALISPCSCSGSMQYIHARCLLEWRATQLDQGLIQQARRCELCHTTYSEQVLQMRLSPQHQPVGATTMHKRWLRLLLKSYGVYVAVYGGLCGLAAGAYAFEAIEVWGKRMFKQHVHPYCRALLGFLLANDNAGAYLDPEACRVDLTVITLQLAYMYSVARPFTYIIRTAASAGFVACGVAGFAGGSVAAVCMTPWLVLRGCRGGTRLLKRTARLAGRCIRAVVRH